MLKKQLKLLQTIICNFHTREQSSTQKLQNNYRNLKYCPETWLRISKKITQTWTSCFCFRREKRLFSCTVKDERTAETRGRPYLPGSFPGRLQKESRQGPTVNWSARRTRHDCLTKTYSESLVVPSCLAARPTRQILSFDSWRNEVHFGHFRCKRS